MQLPAPLSRRKSNVHKNTFGHVLVLAGSKRMLGAAALTSLSALRGGAGLVTCGVPKSLNNSAHKKISHCVMTCPLKETKEASISESAFDQIKKKLDEYQAIAIGPGLSTNPSTAKFVYKIITNAKQPIVIDADAINALSKNISILQKAKAPLILTPHLGEMARLLNTKKSSIEKDRSHKAKTFAQRYHCVLLLKGHRTVVASPNGKIHINKTGNAGMATAGSGDVLTGIISALLAQSLTPFEAAKWGAMIHGKAGDLAAQSHTKCAMIATDIIDAIPQALKSFK